MAKAKKSPAPKPAAPAPASATAPKKAPAAKKPVAKAPAPTISDEFIGQIAGRVWHELSRKDEGLTVADLKKAVDAPPDLVLAAVGWLAREHKLDYKSNGRAAKIALK